MTNATLEVRPLETNKDGILTKVTVDIYFNDKENTHHQMLFDCTDCPEEAMSIQEIKEHMLRMLGGQPGKEEPLY